MVSLLPAEMLVCLPEHCGLNVRLSGSPSVHTGTINPRRYDGVLGLSVTGEKQMAIYKVDNAFVISSNGVWLPGSFSSERAAKYAFRFPNKVLQSLQDKKNYATEDYDKRVISFEDLQSARKDM